MISPETFALSESPLPLQGDARCSGGTSVLPEKREYTTVVKCRQRDALMLPHAIMQTCRATIKYGKVFFLPNMTGAGQ